MKNIEGKWAGRIYGTTTKIDTIYIQLI